MQCLDGIDYDDFQFGAHLIEQKELFMETGKELFGKLCVLRDVEL